MQRYSTLIILLLIMLSTGFAAAGCNTGGSSSSTQAPQLSTTGFVPSDTAYIGSQLPYLSQEHHIDAAWQFSLGQDVVIASLDAGVVEVPELQGQLLPGYDFINEDESPLLTLGEVAEDFENAFFEYPFDHGTPVATIMAARADGKGILGAASRAKILPVRVFTTGGYTTTRVLADAVYYAANSPARVINCSFIAYSKTTSLLEATQYAASRGKIIVAAAGNDELELTEGAYYLSYPACYPWAICVGATRRVHLPDGKVMVTRADFSNYGDYVDIYARGEEVAAAYGFVLNFNEDLFQIDLHFGQAYEDFAGTSAATPVVSAVVALAVSIDPELNVTAVKRLLRETADDFPPYGNKLLNAQRFIEAVIAQRGMPKDNDAHGAPPRGQTAPAVVAAALPDVTNAVLLSAQGRAERQQSLHDENQRIQMRWPQPRRQ